MPATDVVILLTVEPLFQQNLTIRETPVSVVSSMGRYCKAVMLVVVGGDKGVA